MFGQQPTNKTGFGAGSGFGTQSGGGFGGTGNVFGAQTPAPAAGSLFGAPAATTQSSGMFGFGQPQQQQQQQQPQQQTGGTGIFGGATAQPAQTSSLFSTPSSAAAFGSKTPAPTGFGASTQGSSSLFGSTPSSGSSLFGATATGTAAGTLFGTTPTATAFQGTAQSGTTFKYNPPAGQDTMLKSGVSTNITTRHQCITAMKEYETKSLEELRIEDYTANRKGPQAGSTGLFTSTQTTQQPAPATGFTFGANQNKPASTGFGAFGQATSTAAGATSLFGQPTQAQSGGGGGLFGATAATKTPFGATTTTTTASGFGGFGTGTTMFGQANQPPKQSLFGQPTTAPQAQSTSLFGSTATSTPSFGFGANTSGFGIATSQPQQTGGLFGNKPTSFGQTATSTTLPFGQQNTLASGGLFGNKPAGQPTSGFNFGQTSTAGFGTNTSAGSLFGNKTTGFGAAANPLGATTGFGQAGSTLGGGLGAGLFTGAQNKPALGGLGSGFGATTGFGLGNASLAQNNTTGGLLGQPVTGQEYQTANLQLQTLVNSPYGESPLFRSLQSDTISREELLKPTNPVAQKAALASGNQYKVSPRPTARIKPKPIHSLVNNKSQLFDGLEDEESSFGNDTFVPKRSVKKLIIKANESMSNASFSKQSSQLDQTDLDISQAPPSPRQPANENGARQQHESPTFKPPLSRDEHLRSVSLPPRHDQGLSKGLFKNVNESFLNDTISDFNPRTRLGNSLDVSRDSTGEADTNSQRSESPPPHPAGIQLRRHAYYIVPTLDEISELIDDNGDCFVESLVIGREGFGNVMFPGVTNVTNMNLDEIVHFRRKEITIYPEDRTKPPEGSGLNKKALVTLDCVWPADKTTRDYIKDPGRLQQLHYQEKLERATAKIGAKFLDYRPETGSWVFEVKHFSKYGLLDDSDDEEDDKIDPKKMALLKQQQQQQQAIQKQQIKVVPGQEPAHGQGQDTQFGQGEGRVAAQGEGRVMQQGEGHVMSRAADSARMEEVPQPCPLLSGDELDDDLMEESIPKEMDDIDDLDISEVAPSSHRLATRLGVLAEELQLRKASFFGDDEDEIVPKWKAGFSRPYEGVAQSALVSDTPGDLCDEGRWTVGKSLLSTSFSKAPPRQISPQKHVQPLSSATPFGAAFSVSQKHAHKPSEHVILPPSMAQKTRPVVGNRMKRKIPTLGKSLFMNKQHLSMDAGLLQSQRFRVGWGPNWKMAHAGKALMEDTVPDGKDPAPQKFFLLHQKGSVERSRLGTDAQQLLLERLSVSPTDLTKHADKLNQVIEDHLQIQLEHTQMSIESGCPQAVPRPGNDIIQPLIKCAHDSMESLGSLPDCELYRQSSMVWELCQSLWGDLDQHGFEDMRQDSYAYHIARQEAFSDWLRKAVSSRVRHQVECVKAKSGSEASVIFQHLTGHQLEEACDVAQRNGDHQVTLLMAQLSGSDLMRNYVKKQLVMWEQSQMDEFIEPERLKIYAVLAGSLVWRTSLGETVNVCEDLDWKRALGMHLWYHCPPTSTVSDALASYSESFQSDDHHNYAAPPLPHYLEAAMETDDKQDVCYHLLRLFCDRGHPLHRLLCPTSATPNYLDFRLSWQLGQVLQALEYTHISDYHSALLCTSYAAQLETMGLWHWAVFALIHISDHRHREHAVRQVLSRHISLQASEVDKQRESFLQSALDIPAQWIHQAKAVQAGLNDLREEEAWHWLKAEEWTRAHQLILKHLASQAIVNENFADLKYLLGELGSPEVSRTIEDWDKGGRVYLDYITMMETLEQLQQSEPSHYELEQLLSEVIQLSKRIKGLTCHTATDRLCQSEMAKRAANLMRTLLQMNMERDDINEMLVTETTDLPLPEDYGLQELNQLTRCYMLGVALS